MASQVRTGGRHHLAGNAQHPSRSTPFLPLAAVHPARAGGGEQGVWGRRLRLLTEPRPCNGQHTLDLPTLLPQGDSARLQSFVGAIAIADLVKTTLGPKGMDKIIQSVRAGSADVGDTDTEVSTIWLPRWTFAQMSSGDIIVTNDGATIMKSIVVENPAAKCLIDISMSQDDAVGDGTTR